jgi:FAD/FMN-containing dehydrogenase/Fe-S oxidoreductase
MLYDSGMNYPAFVHSLLARRLRREIAGDVLFGPFDRGRYATDASAHQAFPLGVVLPKTQDDVTAALAIAWEAGVPVTARGGGTARSGQAIGEGLILDFSKYLTRLLTYDASAKTCIVEPGITLAALNRALLPQRVWFPIDIASAAQATIGGMTATDAIGWRALRYGRMRDNIVAMDAVLADGAPASFGEIPEDFGNRRQGAAAALILDLLEAAESHADAIGALPQILGAQRGYNFAALLPRADGGHQNVAAFLAGAEGTLAIARRVELKLTRRQQSRALGICHFPTLAAALTAIPAIIALGPTAIELADRRIMDLGIAALPVADPLRRVMRRDSEALLFVEFMEGNRVSNARKLKELTDAMFALKHVRAVAEVIGMAMQKASWAVRGAGLRALAAQAHDGAAVREIAVPLKSLAKAAEGVAEMFSRRGVPLGWHGHAGAGALHLRPWLGREAAVTTAGRDLAEEATALLRSFGGGMAVEDGYGIARSDAMNAVLGDKLTALHEQVKIRFDPLHRLNPGKIVMPPVSDEPALRRPAPPAPPPFFPPDALDCEGNGLCRSLDEGTMCPSFRVTRDERDSPRGRANSLRLALGGALGEGAFTSDEMAETLKLCVSCKACRVECPRAVDIAGAKIAFEAARRKERPLSHFERAAAFLPHYGPRLRRWRHLLNLRDLIPWMAPLSEKLTGLSADRPWPRWRRHPFPKPDPIGDEGGREALLFLDCYNGHFDIDALHAAADVLAASGFRVRPLLPPKDEHPYCCGRGFLEAGLMDEAAAEARRLIAASAPFTEHGAALIGLEPACMLTIRDEWLSMLRVPGAETFAANTLLFEEAMSDAAMAKLAPRLHEIEADALLFSHCHQRAFGTAARAKKLAKIVPGLTLREGDITCCGMGGSFGYRPDCVGVSLQMGEQALFPRIRAAGRDTLLLADGFACRKQIQDGTGRGARHTAVLLKLALLAGERASAGAAGKAEVQKRLKRWRRRYFK